MLTRLKVVGGMLMVALSLAGLSEIGVTAAPDDMVRTVRGEVVATNLKDTPQTIVVRVLLPNKDELTVGASVPPDTRITRAKRPATLADIKVGESVDLTYRRNPAGLAAQAIAVR
jgi:hypothetical protein